MTKRISSNATLQALKPQDKEYMLPDKKVEGLNIRVRPTGTMTWTFRFQIGKKHEKISMGRYIKSKPQSGMTLEQAREEAGRYRGWLENNRNPKLELIREKREQDSAKTFHDAFISFDSIHLSKQLRGEQSRSIYLRDIKPYIGDVRLNDLNIMDLNRVFDAKTDQFGRRKAGAIGVCHKVINQIINHALALNMLDTHPAPQLKAKDVGGGTKITKRNLSFNELELLLSSLNSWKTGASNIRLIKFLLGCGQRVRAVLEMRWEEVDLINRIWVLPASSEERHTKSLESRKIPLSNYLTELLKEQGKEAASDSKIIWSQLNLDKTQESSAIRIIIKRNLPEGIEPFSPHDLRRTFISRCNEMKLDIVAVEKAVGHQLPGMFRVYNHYDYFDEQLQVMQAWGRKLQELSPKKKE